MSYTCKLFHRRCIPCNDGVPKLNKNEIQKLLGELANEWNINTLGHLYKSYHFHDFIGPIEFVNKIAVIAEQEAHHPDLLVSWGKCDVEIWTHKIKGLSEADFVLAAKIDNISNV